MGMIKGVIDKVASRKLAVTAAAGAATGTIELTWPMAVVSEYWSSPEPETPSALEAT